MVEDEEEMTHSPRRSSASSPEFSFWPSSSLPNINPETNVSSADDLFSNGVLLPTVITEPAPDKENDPDREIEPDQTAEPKPDSPAINPASIIASASTPTSSKRWKDIFKVGEKSHKEKSKPTPTEETKNRAKHHKAGPTGSTDISINIWPFGRSRSAGTAGSCRKPTGVAPVRKSSSAPCSRSNSRGESGKPGSVGRRWAASPGRPGVHVGRSSPVWQIKRNGGSGNNWNRPVEPVKVSTGSARVINLSVNSCIGYGRREVSCGGENKDRVTSGDRNGGLFGIKGLFSKKVH